MADPLPINTRHARQQPRNVPPPAVNPPPPAAAPVFRAPPADPFPDDDRVGFGSVLRFFGMVLVLALVLIGLVGLENILSPFINSSQPVVIQPPRQAAPQVRQPPQHQPVSPPRRSTGGNNQGQFSYSDSCTPSSRFSVGVVAVVDLASSSGASTRITAWTQPGGSVHNSDAEPGMRLSIVGGPECVYNERYGQYIRYWQVEFTNRSGRYVSGNAWVAESVWEGSYVNYLICPLSQPDC